MLSFYKTICGKGQFFWEGIHF